MQHKASLSAYLRSFPLPVWLLIAATLIESLGRFMVVPYLSLYMRGEGVDLGTLGLVLGAAPVANVVFGAWGGQLSDRLGRKPVQILGVSISGLSMFGFALAGANPFVLALLNFMNGMTRTFYRPATSAALSDLCPAGKRSEAFALNRIAINAAFGIGPVLGVAIFQVHPMYGFILAGSVNLLVGLFIALVIPESAPGLSAASRAQTAYSTAKASAAGSRAQTVNSIAEASTASCQEQQLAATSRQEDLLTGSRQEQPGSRQPPANKMAEASAAGQLLAGKLPAGKLAAASAWKSIVRDSGFWVWTAGMMLIWGAYDLIQSFLPLHFQARGVALWVYSAVLSCNALVCVFVQLPVSRRLRTSPFALSAGLSKLGFIVGFLGFAFARSPLVLLLSMLILSLGEVWGSAVQVRYIPEHAPPALLGRYMGLSMVSELGRAIAAPAAGFIMAAVGGSAVFLMAAGLASGGGLLLYTAGRWQDQRR